MADPEALRGPDEMPPQSEFAKRAGIRLVEATRDRVVCEMMSPNNTPTATACCTAAR